MPKNTFNAVLQIHRESDMASGILDIVRVDIDSLLDDVFRPSQQV